MASTSLVNQPRLLPQVIFRWSLFNPIGLNSNFPCDPTIKRSLRSFLKWNKSSSRREWINTPGTEHSAVEPWFSGLTMHSLASRPLHLLALSRGPALPFGVVWYNRWIHIYLITCILSNCMAFCASIYQTIKQIEIQRCTETLLPLHMKDDGSP